MPAVPFAGAFPALGLVDPLVVANLLFLGLGASAACFATWNFAVKHLGAVVTSTYIYLVPALTAPPQPSWLGEPMTPPIVGRRRPHHRRPHAFEPQRLSPRATPRPRLALLFVDVVQWPERQGIAARTSSMALTHHHRHVEERTPVAAIPDPVQTAYEAAAAQRTLSLPTFRKSCAPGGRRSARRGRGTAGGHRRERPHHRRREFLGAAGGPRPVRELLPLLLRLFRLAVYRYGIRGMRLRQQLLR